jgi:hypothetical protein
MNMPAWMTMAIAIYGAVLATTNIVLILRAKRWRIKVTRTYLNNPDGTQAVHLHASNVGERSVTIVSAFLQSEVYRWSLLNRARQWVRNLTTTDKTRLRKVHMTYAATRSLSGHDLPVELKPGDTLAMAIDLTTIPLEPVGSSYVGVLDALGKNHYCKDIIILPSVKRGQLVWSGGLQFTVSND